MLARSGIAKGGHAGGFASGRSRGLAKRADAHAVLLNALADKENSYRRWMRPADIIAQNMSERPKPKPVALSPGFAELLWKFVRRELSKDSDQPLLNRRAEQFVGRRYVLDSAIVNGQGKARVGDSVWLVEGPELPAGAQIEVIAVNGTALKVQPVV